MDVRDKAFLNDMVQFTYMNHITSVYAHRKALNPAEPNASMSPLEDIAVFAVTQLRHYASQEDALADVRKNNDDKRVETIVSAKIFAELMAALEDLGALGDAIRHRKTKGIFRRYLASSTGQAAGFYDFVIQQDTQNYPNATLEDLLSLPTTRSIEGRVSSQLLETFAQSYRLQAQNLRSAARIYRDQGTKMAPIGPEDPVPANWRDDVNILLDVLPLTGSQGQANRAAPSPTTLSHGGLLARAFNKIKHRFMVTENLTAYMDATGAVQLEYGRFPQEPHFIDQLLNNTLAVAGTMAELCAIIVQLDSNGIAL